MRRRWLPLALLPLLLLARRPTKPEATTATETETATTTTTATATATATATEPTAADTEPPPRIEAPPLDLHAHPDTAPALIRAVAELALPDRDAAARTLARWLAQESARDTADARGNVPNLIEALGELGGDVANAALALALEDRSYDLALQTLIVQQLGAEIPRASLARFAARAANAPARDDLEVELRDEALTAADDSGRLAHLRRTP
ncbi:MAG: hypothetical protein KIT84_41410 [Labilithrix sp.]|nr:hypothetical protein [Labilithrix sp.]MCW5817530.1 hypothetical protein [Labilithrix sp.]